MVFFARFLRLPKKPVTGWTRPRQGVRPVDEFIGRATAFAGKPGSHSGFVAPPILDSQTNPCGSWFTSDGVRPVD
jgi:hypothetical protein